MDSGFLQCKFSYGNLMYMIYNILCICSSNKCFIICVDKIDFEVNELITNVAFNMLINKF